LTHTCGKEGKRKIIKKILAAIILDEMVPLDLAQNEKKEKK